MSNAKLSEPYNTLENDIIETLKAGSEVLESYSDMQRAIRAVLMMFEVKRRPLPIDLPIPCGDCGGIGYFRSDKFHSTDCIRCNRTGKDYLKCAVSR